MAFSSVRKKLMLSHGVPNIHVLTVGHQDWQSERSNRIESFTSDARQAKAAIQTGETAADSRMIQSRFYPRSTSPQLQLLEAYRRSGGRISLPSSQSQAPHSDLSAHKAFKATDPLSASECPVSMKLPDGCERVMYASGTGHEFPVAVKTYPGDPQFRRVAVDMKTGEPLKPPCVLKKTPSSDGFVYMRTGLIGGSPPASPAMPAIYGDVTDPTKHDPEGEWRYLVNAVPNHHYEDSTLTAFTETVPDEKTKEDIKEKAKRRRMVLEDPAMMGEELNPCASLIDPRHTNTLSPNGYILRAPQSLIAMAHHDDVGSPSIATPLEIEEWKKRKGYSVRSAEDVLKNTPEQRYNEVFIHKNRGSGETREATVVEATFSKINIRDGSYFDEKTALLMQDIGKKFNLPHVNIECYSRFTPDKVYRAPAGRSKDKIIYVDIEDRRYSLAIFVWARDEGRELKNFPMTDQDVDFVLSFLEKNGVAEAELNDIKEKYNKFKDNIGK